MSCPTGRRKGCSFLFEPTWFLRAECFGSADTYIQGCINGLADRVLHVGQPLGVLLRNNIIGKAHCASCILRASDRSPGLLSAVLVTCRLFGKRRCLQHATRFVHMNVTCTTFQSVSSAGLVHPSGRCIFQCEQDTGWYLPGGWHVDLGGIWQPAARR